MKKLLAAVVGVVALGTAFTGCAYGGIAVAGDKVVVTRNDAFLFGALRSVYVCKVADTGLSSCKSADAP